MIIELSICWMQNLIHKVYKERFKKYLYYHWIVKHVIATLTLGSRPRQGLARVWAKSEAWESYFMLLGVWESVREWTSTLPNELPLWELESQWTLKSLEGDCKRQNSLDWKVPYIIEKLLERKCLKWARMIHLDIWNISYGQKKD